MNALKEWATVVSALESGDQTVILRKGGILETASGFVVESEKFLLFPTFEHQSLENIKPQFHNHLKSAMQAKPKDGTSKITSYAEVLAESDVTSERKVGQLSEFHIWSEPYIRARISWMPDKPIKALFLKTYTVPEFEIISRPEFQGCKSWININANIGAGKPVVGEAELESRLEKFKDIVN